MHNVIIDLPGSFVGHTMREFDFSRPMSVVRKSRKSPYYRTIAHTTSQTRVGFYCGGASARYPKLLFMDKQGSTFALRLEYANDVLLEADRFTRLSDIDGYYTDNYGDGDTMQPIVARLTHSRGFLCGWTYGPGMCAVLDTSSVYDDAVDAARAAHQLAESDAEQEREYQEREAERERQEEADELEEVRKQEQNDGDNRDSYDNYSFAGDE